MSYSNHIYGWNAFCETDNNLNACFNCFQNGISGKRGWYKNCRCIGAGSINRCLYCIENGNAFERLRTLARGNPSNNIGSVFYHLPRMECTLVAGYTLNNYTRMFINYDAHFSTSFREQSLVNSE